MGGYGALKCVLTNPENYNTCCAFSSSCLFIKEDLERSEGSKNFKELYGNALFKDFQAIFGENIQWNPQEDVIELAKNTAKKEEKPFIYISCGNDDFLLNDNKRFYQKLKDLDYNVKFKQSEGNHNWQFFDNALKNALEYCFKEDE